MKAVHNVSGEDRVLLCFSQSWLATLGKPVYIVLCTRESPGLKLVFHSFSFELVNSPALFTSKT